MRLILKEEANRYQEDTAGDYILQNELVNTYPHWKSDKHCLWFHLGGANWKIGLTSSLGSGNGGIMGPYSEDDWPSNIFANWKYHDGTKWCVAGSGDVVCEDLMSNGNYKINTETMFINQFSIYQ